MNLAVALPAAVLLSLPSTVLAQSGRDWLHDRGDPELRYGRVHAFRAGPPPGRK